MNRFEKRLDLPVDRFRGMMAGGPFQDFLLKCGSMLPGAFQRDQRVADVLSRRCAYDRRQTLAHCVLSRICPNEDRFAMCYGFGSRGAIMAAGEVIDNDIGRGHEVAQYRPCHHEIDEVCGPAVLFDKRAQIFVICPQAVKMN